VTHRERAEIDRLREVVARQVTVAKASAAQIKAMGEEMERMLSELEEFVSKAGRAREDGE
jgi:hypothetical protein